jgi:hypothetical protein
MAIIIRTLCWALIFIISSLKSCAHYMRPVVCKARITRYWIRINLVPRAMPMRGLG